MTRYLIPGAFGLAAIFTGLYFTFFHMVRDLLELRKFHGAVAVEVDQVIKCDRERTSSSGVRYKYGFRYRYSFGGTDYISENATAYKGQTTNGDLESRIYDNIIMAQSNSSEILCYVNPDDPSDAVLDNSFSIKTFGANLLLIIGPLAIGGYAVFCASYEWKKQAEE
jgi:hypothetical protein